MTETEFQQEVAGTLAHIEAALDELDVDVDFERKADTVLELLFEDDSRIVINGHGVARELWIAARSGGQHFRFADGAWVNTRDGRDFYAALSTVVGEQCGKAVALKA